MLRYLAPVTLGVCTAAAAVVGAGIFSGGPAESGSTPPAASLSASVASSLPSRLPVPVPSVPPPLPATARLPVSAARCQGSPPAAAGGTAGPSEPSPPAVMDYKEEAERMAQRVYELYNDKDWKMAKTSDIPIDSTQKDIRVLYKKSKEFDGYVYRAECTLDASPERILEYILPSPKGLRGKWDKNVKESEVIEHINKDLIVARSATHSASMGLISSRDFLDLIYVKRYPTNNMVCTHSKSIKRKDCAPRDGFVRGTNYHGGTFCIPVDGETNRTRVINMVQSDLGGMLPRALVDSALPSNLIDFYVDLGSALKANIE